MNKTKSTSRPLTLTVSASDNTAKRHYLDHDGKCWIELTTLSENRIKEITEDFDHLFSLHPIEDSSVLVYNKDNTRPEWVETKCHRWYDTYLRTPEFTEEIQKSYMFAGKKSKQPEKDLPEPFKKYFESLKGVTEEEYNQIVINWYENENDFIPMHSDWVDGLVPDSTISILNFEDSNANKVWNFILEPREDSDSDSNSIYSKITIPLKSGMIITMGGQTQDYFRHGVPAISDNISENRRISFTARRYL